jgi:DNA recombination protein RmuC
MKDHCDFFEQQTVETDDGNRRPDMRIELPGGKNVVVDAKVPLQAYMEAIDAATDSERAARLSDHARQVRAHIEALADRAYWDACRPTPEFVVLFLPGEMFFSAALQQDPSLIEDGARKRVILATPTTLIALLKAVFYGWRQEQLAENARRISEAGQSLYERMATMSEHFGRIGASLSASVKAYNSAVGSMKDRVFPAARRLKELGVASKKEVEQIEEIDSAPRQAMLPIIENGDRDSNGK